MEFVSQKMLPLLSAPSSDSLDSGLSMMGFPTNQDNCGAVAATTNLNLASSSTLEQWRHLFHSNTEETHADISSHAAAAAPPMMNTEATSVTTRALPPHPHHTGVGGHFGPTAKVGKKRSRASRRAPTTLLSTDTSNFRAMVQQFTGIPEPPFATPRAPLFGRSLPQAALLPSSYAHLHQQLPQHYFSSSSLPLPSLVLRHDATGGGAPWLARGPSQGHPENLLNDVGLNPAIALSSERRQGYLF